MKKILIFTFALLWSKTTLADAGIPLLALLGSNLIITNTLMPPFILGILYFWIVCVIERRYIVNKLNIKEKITRPIVIANIYSTLCGIPLSIGLYFIQLKLCDYFPYSGSDGHLICLIIGPFVIAPLVNLFLLWLMSWFVEYKYLKKTLDYPELKKTLIFANIYSYLGIFVTQLGLGFCYIAISKLLFSVP